MLVAFHALAFAAIYLLAFLVRFDAAVPTAGWTLVRRTLPAVVVLKLAVFLAMGCHRGWWRYATFADLIGLGEAAALATAAVLLADALWWDATRVPRSIVLMDWAGTLLLIGGIRGSTRLLRERYFPMVSGRRPRRALIVGATESGVALARAIQAQTGLELQIVGFLDNNLALRGRDLMGIRVLGTPDEARALAARHKASIVLAPTPAVPATEIRALVADCASAAIKVQVVPGVDALLRGELAVRPRDVDIHDLLCRDPVQLDGESVGRFLRDRVVLVTGAAGSIGSEICRQALAFRPRRLVLLDHNENGLFYVERELRDLATRAGVDSEGRTEVVAVIASITDAPRIRAEFENYRPAVVFHAAAHKHVPLMEANPGEAAKNNVLGTRTVADEAVRSGVHAFVMISSDKAVNPANVMGATKRLAEMYVQSLSGRAGTRLVTVRFGNVLGSNGSVIPLFKEQIARGGPVTVTDPEMVRYFMTIAEASQLVLQAGALGRGGEIFVLDMGAPVRIVDLARDLIRLSGLRVGRDIEIVFTGTRPGEKLYEELYETNEVRVSTPHPKIFAAQHRPCAGEWLRGGLDRLARAAAGQAHGVVEVLRELVPEYTPAKAVPAASAVRHDTRREDANPRQVADRREPGTAVGLYPRLDMVR